MKNKHLYLVLILNLLTFFNTIAQDFSTGYQLMEKGAFEKATVYFQNQKAKYPQNKTVQLCYARSLGLSSDPKSALSMLEQLSKSYPEDLEVKLNTAEAYLWNKQIQPALNNYLKLISDYPESFPVLMGLANSYSGIKDYPKALKAINKALLLKPKNEGAKTSKFYITLGYADSSKKQKDYQQAISLLTQLLIEYPDNTQGLTALGMVYFEQKEFSMAQEVFGSISNATQRFSHLALLSQAQGNSKVALAQAREAIKISAQASLEDMNLAMVRYIQALLWNSKFKEAKAQIELLKTQPNQEETYLSLLANWYSYTDRPKASLEACNALLNINPKSFDGLMGKAASYRALNQKNKAITSIDSVLHYYPGQADALALKKTVEQSLNTKISTQFSYQEDNGNNRVNMSGVNLQIVLNEKHQLSLTYNNRETTQLDTQLSAASNQIRLGYTTRVHNRSTVTLSAGFTKVNSDARPYTQWNANLAFKTTLMPRNSFQLSFERNIQDFNTVLLASELVLNNYILSNNSMIVGNLGWYTQARYVSLSDANKSQQVFTSLYYSFGKKTLFKTGVNYQYLTFKDRTAALYFSPESFQNGEVFARLEHAAKRFNYASEIAVGSQFIEQESAMNTFRASLDINYKYSQRFNLKLFGRYSNSASDTASGFSYFQAGIGGMISL